MDQNPSTLLKQIAGGHILARCLHVAASLGVADVLQDTPMTAAEIASPLGVHPEALNRVMRLLSANGIFQTTGDKYIHSPMSRLLQSDHPKSMRAAVRNLGRSLNWAIYQELEYSVRTNRPASEKVVPGGFWAALATNPEESRVFNEAMEIKSRDQVAGVIDAYDFSPFALIGDIGGGHGQLIIAILERFPSTKGLLFDQAQVIEEVRDLNSERLRLAPGDFFKDEFPVCDIYLLMEVLHDWGDDEALTILKAIRQAAPDHARLLVIERIINDDPGPDWTKSLDINMLALFGSKQRTRAEFDALFTEAGFSSGREIRTNAAISVLESLPTEYLFFHTFPAHDFHTLESVHASELAEQSYDDRTAEETSEENNSLTPTKRQQRRNEPRHVTRVAKKNTTGREGLIHQP